MIQLDDHEAKVLYVAAVFYQSKGTPGLAAQDDEVELMDALERVLAKLEREVA